MNREKISLVRAIESLLIFCVLCIVCILVPRMHVHEEQANLHQVRKLEGWYRIQDGEKKSVQLPAVIDADQDGTLTLYNESLTGEMAGSQIASMAAVYEIEIRLDNQILYKYSDGLFPRNNQMKGKISCNVYLPSELEGKVLSVTYFGQENASYEVPDILIGGSAEILYYRYYESTVSYLIVLLMFVVGILSLIIGIYIRWLHMKDTRFLDAAAFLLICSVWVVTDSPFIRAFSRYASVFSMISFYAFMLFSIPMLHFIQNTEGMKKYRQLDICILLLYLNAFIQGILCYFQIFSMIQMLFATHILLFGGVLLCVILLWTEFQKYQSRETKVLLQAFSVLGGSGILALLLYWILEISNYELIFEVGILIFGSIIVNEVFLAVVRDFKYHAELQAYQRMAREDQLTGLGNRRAFEDYILEIQEIASVCKNIGLVFMDVNNLKYVNDHFGHNSGDELIIGAARCIKDTYERYGKCFRLGGDEFCVVIVDPEKNEQQWINLLQENVEIQNRNRRNPLSIAIGISYLKNGDGTMKRISDWKFEADQNMYKDKERRRR